MRKRLGFRWIASLAALVLATGTLAGARTSPSGERAAAASTRATAAVVDVARTTVVTTPGPLDLRPALGLLRTSFRHLVQVLPAAWPGIVVDGLSDTPDPTSMSGEDKSGNDEADEANCVDHGSQTDQAIYYCPR